jgi:hypothetical protein
MLHPLFAVMFLLLNETDRFQGAFDAATERNERAATCQHRCAVSSKQADIPSPPIGALASIQRLSSRQPLHVPCPQPEKS